MSSNGERQPLLDNKSINAGDKQGAAHSRNRLLLYACAVVCVCLVGGTIAGLMLVGRSFSQDCVHDKCALARYYQGCLSAAPVIGIAILVFVVPFGVMALGTVFVEVAHKTSTVSRSARTTIFAALSFLLLLGFSACWAWLLKPWSLYDWEPAPHEDQLVNDVLLVLIGGFYAFVSFPLAVVCAIIAWQSATGRAVMLHTYSHKRTPSAAGLISPLSDTRTGSAISAGSPVPMSASRDVRSLSVTGGSGTDLYDSDLDRASPSNSKRSSNASTVGRRLRISPLPCTPKSVSANLPTIVAVLVLLVVIAFCDSTFSSVWNYSAHSYFMANSTYSIIGELGRVNDRFVFKVYLDVVVYFSVAAFVVVVGSLGHLYAPFRRVLHTRVNISRKLFPLGVTVGELLLLLSMSGLFGFWLYFWRWGYDRIEEETHAQEFPIVCCNSSFPINSTETCTIPGDSHVEVHVWARVFGHLTTLCMSFLILPTARYSVWECVFGVPYERAVKFHRGLGVLTWALVTTHMALWMVKWAMEDILANNIVTIHNLLIWKHMPHSDNFTIVLNETSWLLLTVMVAIAYWKRRDNYELFYYTHYFGIVFYITAIVHAWTFWYYAVGGLSLWLLDRCVRLVRQTRRTQLLACSYDPAAQITTIKFRAVGGPLNHYAAQYCFVSIPQVSSYEWHPFTVSSPPSSNVRTFHIKVWAFFDIHANHGTVFLLEIALTCFRGVFIVNRASLCLSSARYPPFPQNMGKDTFTGRLADAVHSVERPLTLRIDGPYGRPAYFDDHTHLLFVAGGIGITPIHSTVMEIFHRVSAGRTAGRIQHMTLVWVCRSSMLISLFPALRDAAAVQPGLLDLQFYLTSDDSPEHLPVSEHSSEEHQLMLDQIRSSCIRHRPDLTDIASQLPAGRDTMVFACGPKGLISASSQAAFRFGMSFHSEEFEW